MKLRNNYKVLYDKAKVGYATKDLLSLRNASKMTLCKDGDSSKEIHLYDYKLVYEKDGFIYGSMTGYVSSSDDLITGLDKAGKVVFGKIIYPPSVKHSVTISRQSIDYRQVSGVGQYSAGQTVEVKFIISVHFDIEHILADKDLEDLVVTSGTSETEGNWVKATFTMPNEDVVLTLSSSPIIKLNTTVPYASLVGFNKTYTPGTNNIYLRIVDIDDNYDYIAEGRDATDTDIGFNWQQKVYDMGEPIGYEMEVAEMPETDLTINFNVQY